MTQTPSREHGAPTAARGAAADGDSTVERRTEGEVSDGGTPARVTVLVTDLRSELSSAIEGAPRWLTGAGAGLQAVLLSLVVVVVPVVAVYVAGSAAATGSDAGWLGAAALGVDFWLLAHGVPLTTGVGIVSIVPLGLSALAGFCAFASARRSGTPSRAGFAGALGAYVLAVVGVAALTLIGAPEAGPSAARVLLGSALGALVIGGAGLGGGLAVRADAPRMSAVLAPARRRVPRAVWVGAGGGLAVLAGTVAVGGVVVVTWVLAGQAQIAQIVASLHLDALGGVGLAVAELAFVPNLVAWAVAWLAGPGFAVGVGSHFATTGVLGTTLPAIPLLGALPSPESVTPTAAWWPVSLVMLGALVGLVLRRRLGDVSPAAALGAAVTAAVTAGVAIMCLVGAAGGAAGPGRMAQVGASGFVTGVAVACAAGAGVVLVLVGSNARLVARVRELVGAGVARVRSH